MKKINLPSLFKSRKISIAEWLVLPTRENCNVLRLNDKYFF